MLLNLSLLALNQVASCRSLLTWQQRDVNGPQASLLALSLHACLASHCHLSCQWCSFLLLQPLGTAYLRVLICCTGMDLYQGTCSCPCAYSACCASCACCCPGLIRCSFLL